MRRATLVLLAGLGGVAACAETDGRGATVAGATALGPAAGPFASRAGGGAEERTLALQCASAAAGAAYLARGTPLAPPIEQDAGIWVAYAGDAHGIGEAELAATAVTLVRSGTVARLYRLCSEAL